MSRAPAEREGERGYLMVAVTVAVAVLVIGSLVTFQAFEDMMHREREAEMMFRAQEYARAIQRYRKAVGASPDKLEKLMEPGPQGQYFLRQLYEDPLTGDGKWGLLFLGPGGNILDPNSPTGLPGLPGGVGGIGNDATQGQNTGIGGLANSGSFDAGIDKRDKRQDGIGGLANSGDSILNPGDGPGSGMPIAGVKSLSDLQAFRVYKGLEDYAMWYFTYLDVEQRMLQLAGGKGKRPTSQRGGGLQLNNNNNNNAPQGGTPPPSGN